MAREPPQNRGRGRFQGRGGRPGRGGGRKSQRSGQKNASTTPSQQKVLQFAPNAQGKPQTATFATVKEAIIQQIEKTFPDGHDIAVSIKKGVLYDLDSEAPVWKISTNADPDEARREQDGFNMLYQSKLNSFVQHEENLRKGMVTAYALIFSYCNNVMQLRVKEHPEFAKSIEHDPIKLLEAIQVLMHDPIRAQYPVISMTEALATSREWIIAWLC